MVLIGGSELEKHANKNIKVINHKKFKQLDEMQKFLFELRKEKGLTFNDAKKLLQDENYFATVFVKMGFADGIVEFHPWSFRQCGFHCADYHFPA